MKWNTVTKTNTANIATCATESSFVCSVARRWFNRRF
jgi:hypothetical protein